MSCTKRSKTQKQANDPQEAGNSWRHIPVKRRAMHWTTWQPCSSSGLTNHAGFLALWITSAMTGTHWWEWARSLPYQHEVRYQADSEAGAKQYLRKQDSHTVHQMVMSFKATTVNKAKILISFSQKKPVTHQISKWLFRRLAPSLPKLKMTCQPAPSFD